MSSHKVTFRSIEDFKLVGILSIPDGKAPFPIVVMCHGRDSSKDSESYTTLEKLLIEIGIASFRFDYRGHGESDFEHANLTVTGTIRDISSVIDYLYKN